MKKINFIRLLENKFWRFCRILNLVHGQFWITKKHDKCYQMEDWQMRINLTKNRFTFKKALVMKKQSTGIVNKRKTGCNIMCSNTPYRKAIKPVWHKSTALYCLIPFSLDLHKPSKGHQQNKIPSIHKSLRLTSH